MQHLCKPWTLLMMRVLQDAGARVIKRQKISGLLPSGWLPHLSPSLHLFSISLSAYATCARTNRPSFPSLCETLNCMIFHSKTRRLFSLSNFFLNQGLQQFTFQQHDQRSFSGMELRVCPALHAFFVAQSVSLRMESSQEINNYR